MTKYDDLFDETVPNDDIIADMGVLDPLAEPDEVVARENQERELAQLLNGIEHGYPPQQCPFTVCLERGRP